MNIRVYFFSIYLLLLFSCNNNSLKERELEIKQKELDLKERELNLKEKDSLQQKPAHSSEQLIREDSIVKKVEPNNGPSIKETVDWLNNLFGGNQPLMPGSMFSSYQHLKISYDGTFIIKEKRFWKNSGEENVTVTGNFKDFSKNISFKLIDDYAYFYVKCITGECLTQTDDKNIYKLKDVAIAYFEYTRDRSLVKRVQAAFSHLVTLCGGKDEAF